MIYATGMKQSLVQHFVSLGLTLLACQDWAEKG